MASKITQAIFQSTPPARGATPGRPVTLKIIGNFNPRPPRGGRHALDRNGSILLYISIHAPREGGDSSSSSSKPRSLYFNPRPPRGGRHESRIRPCVNENFNPRPPRGGRPCTHGAGRLKGGFQSTPPARGATKSRRNHSKKLNISIHAPREGGDGVSVCRFAISCYFNPRPPRGGRHALDRNGSILLYISIHAPREGGDGVSVCRFAISCYFNPRPPRGGRQYTPLS